MLLEKISIKDVVQWDYRFIKGTTK